MLTERIVKLFDGEKHFGGFQIARKSLDGIQARSDSIFKLVERLESPHVRNKKAGKLLQLLDFFDAESFDHVFDENILEIARQQLAFAQHRIG